MSIENPVTDKEHEARWDAQTLAQAESIKADPSRLSAAQQAAKALADKQIEDQRAMRKVAGKKTDPAPRKMLGIKIAITSNNAPPKTSGFNVFQKI